MTKVVPSQVVEVIDKIFPAARPAEVYPEVKKIMGLNPIDFSEEYQKHKSDAIKWKNKTAWAREYMRGI